MGIRLLPSGRVQARIRVGGRDYSETFDDPADAEDWLVLVQARHIQGATPTRLTVREYAARWIATYDRNPKNTVAFYQSGLVNILAAIGERPLARVTSTDIKVMLNRIEADSGAGAAERTFRTVSALFGAAVADELVTRSPVISRKHRPRRQRKPMVVLERVEARQMLLQLGGWQRDTATLQLAFGARYGEIAGLTRHDIVGGTILIARRYSYNPDTVRAIKNHRARRLDLPRAFARTTIARLLAQADADRTPPIPDLQDREWPARPFDRRWLIQTSTGRPANLSALNKSIKQACRDAGVPVVTSHGLRHSYVSWMIDDGHTSDQIAHWIGDTPQTVQGVYSHMLSASSRSAADTIDAALGDLG